MVNAVCTHWHAHDLIHDHDDVWKKLKPTAISLPKFYSRPPPCLVAKQLIGLALDRVECLILGNGRHLQPRGICAPSFAQIERQQFKRLLRLGDPAKVAGDDVAHVCGAELRMRTPPRTSTHGMHNRLVEAVPTALECVRQLQRQAPRQAQQWSDDALQLPAESARHVRLNETAPSFPRPVVGWTNRLRQRDQIRVLLGVCVKEGVPSPCKKDIVLNLPRVRALRALREQPKQKCTLAVIDHLAAKDSPSARSHILLTRQPQMWIARVEPQQFSCIRLHVVQQPWYALSAGRLEQCLEAPKPAAVCHAARQEYYTFARWEHRRG